jgi:hypothetical protein
MSTSRTRFTLAAVGGLLVVAAGCMRSTGRIYPPNIDAAAAGKQAIDQFDANKDGVLDAQELEKAPGLLAGLKRIDANADGRINADEITACIRKWQETRTGRTTISVRVKRADAPLEGATVTLMPEKFLGTDIKTATGTTDSHGVTIPTVPVEPGEPPGVACGFYRVEITKSGVDIPAEYNTATKLGAEVAPDAEELRTGYDFEIK